jgi:hypothetical protein
MLELRNRPKGARFAFFGLGLCVFALIPTEVGYQDIASLLARQPGVTERWQKRVFGNAQSDCAAAPALSGVGFPQGRSLVEG